MVGRNPRSLSNSVWSRPSPTGGTAKSNFWARTDRPASGSSTSSSALSTAMRALTSQSGSSCGPAMAGPRSARSGGSRLHPGPKLKATGASSAGSTSATPTARRHPTPLSWSSATPARRLLSGAARWTSSPGITSTTRPTAGTAAWPRSIGSTTSKPALPPTEALGDRSTSNIVCMLV